MKTALLIGLLTMIGTTISTLTANTAKNKRSVLPASVGTNTKKSSTLRTVKSEKEFYNVIEQARTTGKGIIIKFYAPWCSACGRMEKSFPAYAQKNKEHTLAIAIDVDNPDLASISETFQIKKLPTFITLNIREGALSDQELDTLFQSNHQDKKTKKVPKK
jgi:thiol-disulfide isomerase/thioredoxin